MKPINIILVRHGQSEGNVNKEVYATKPDYTLNLTELGRTQAKDAGKFLIENYLTDDPENTQFYVSPFFRTRETFECIASAYSNPTELQYKEDPRLREQEWGHCKPVVENDRINRERDEYGQFYFRIADGESGADVFDRVSDFMSTMYRDFEKDDFPANVVIVTHGLSIRLFLMRWFHLTVEEFEDLANPDNCECIVMTRKEPGFSHLNKKYKLLKPLKSHAASHGYQRPINLKTA